MFPCDDSSLTFLELLSYEAIGSAARIALVVDVFFDFFFFF